MPRTVAEVINDALKAPPPKKPPTKCSCTKAQIKTHHQHVGLYDTESVQAKFKCPCCLEEMLAQGPLWIEHVFLDRPRFWDDVNGKDWKEAMRKRKLGLARIRYRRSILRRIRKSHGVLPSNRCV